jgi:UDP-N-acetylglucosamine pyrophosphorylase
VITENITFFLAHCPFSSFSFSASIPNVLELDRLTLSGDVTFGKNVTLSGLFLFLAYFIRTTNYITLVKAL